MKKVICAIIKDEQPYLVEWIEHHLNLGFDSIYLYEDINSSSHRDIIKKYSNDTVILNKVKNIPGISNTNSRQQLVYEYFCNYAKNNKISDWVALIDIDEFIITDNLDNLLKKYINNTGILLEWKIYGANGFIRKPNGLVMKNFTRQAPLLKNDKSWNFKSIVNINKYQGLKNHHEVLYGIKIKFGSWINHYFTKSWEEWEKSYWLRGDLLPGHRKLEQFFDINPDLSIYKDELIKKSISKYSPDNSNNKIALCAVAKNENKYIRDWVEYYKSIGIDHIYLYDNNDIDGEKFEDVINDYIQNNYVTIIDIRGQLSDQDILYINCYNNYKSKYSWMMFFDIDEYLVMCNNKTLKEYLLDNRFSNIDTILVNWELYGDSNKLEYEDIPVMERFNIPLTNIVTTKHFSRDAKQVKSIVRCKSNINISKNNKLICFTHKFLIEPNLKHCDSDGNILESPDYPTRYSIDHVIYNNMKLNHYISKTIGEFVLRQRNRGGSLKFREQYSFEDIINNFKNLGNVITPEKLEIANKVYKSNTL